MNLRDRIGFDAGATQVEDALKWATKNGFHYVDFNADHGPNHLLVWSEERIHNVRETCARNEIHLGLHTMSGVNVADFSPYVGEGVDEYLKANIDFAVTLGCDWVEVHAGYHFSAVVEDRMKASLERLKRTAEHAKQAGMTLLMENLNFEPDDAEVHYLAHNIEECRYYFEAIAAEDLRWAFTANHANLVPEGIGGFLDAFGTDRIEEVRLADNLGVKEVHLNPGEGNIDFESLFRRMESAGDRHHYMMAFGSPDDKLKARDFFASLV